MLKESLKNLLPPHALDEHDLRCVARACARVILEPCTLLLSGDLGAGKTTFAQAFIQEKIPGVDVTSPTFNIIHTYDESAPPLLHADLYRLESPDEVEQTGFFDLVPDYISLVEWPERLNNQYPKHAIHVAIHIEPHTDKRRLIIT